MTFAATGTMHGAQNAAVTLANQGIGNLLIVSIVNISNNSVWATGLTGGGATFAQAGVRLTGTTNAFSAAVFLGKVTATGAQTGTPTWSGTAPGNYGIAAQEFTTSVGNWEFDKQGNLDSAGTATWPSLTAATGAGELYFGFMENAASAVAGSTSGYVYSANADGNGDGAAYNVNCPGTATAPVWGDSAQRFGIAVLIQEAVTKGGMQVITRQAVKRASLW